MAHEELNGLLNGLASDFMFFDAAEIDIPASGAFLNKLDLIAAAANTEKMNFVGELARCLSNLLEKIILNDLEDKTAGAAALAAGISLIQTIVDSYHNTGRYDGSIQDFLARITVLTGETVAVSPTPVSPTLPEDTTVPPAETTVVSPTAAEPESGNTPPPQEIVEIQDESLLRDFITEALEYIGEIEINILNLEKNPTDKDYINAIFRPFHSIKGVASFLNLDHIRDLAHNLENLLDKARNNELAVNPPLIDVVLDGADTLKTMIGQLRDKVDEKVQEIYKLDISSLVSRIKNVEKGEAVPAKAQKLGEILIAEGNITPEVLTAGLKIAQNTPNKKLGETLIVEGQVTAKQVSQALRKQAEQVTDQTNIRVDTRKLDDMIDMVGELVIMQSMVQQDIKNQFNPDKNLIRDIAQFIRITSGLQKTSTSLRMVPIKQTFQRMSRLVRDLAKSSGKIVTVEMVGEDTEIDRNMVDEIYNPLVHMIRNSVDHGLEMPEERLKQGKDENGLIRLKAYHRGGNVVIEIADDGKGLDKEKILNKALKSGILANGEGLSTQDIYRLIFLPGLSTAEKVTDVSGRGVGMDVVRGAVEKLRGKIEIGSTYGKGTTFTASFPLTLAIIGGMIVRVGPEFYILPTTAIRQVLRPPRESYNNVIGKGEMINVMGQLLPLVRLYSLFGVPPVHENPWEAIIVVIEGEKSAKCLLVDEIIGKTEVVIKSLGNGVGKIKGVSGGAILGDGRIGLILDTEGLFEIMESKNTQL
jgi:two-component system chemotaxis sensor kinase CheA